MAEEPVVSQEAHGSYIAQATGGGTATIQVYTSPPTLADQNRARFLIRLRTRYRDLLEQSLHGAVRLTLELAGHPEAVTPPVRLLYQPGQQPAHPLPAGTSLAQVYVDAGQELLVLGEPGAGKSTLLLELAFDLVQQAEQDQSLLLPVIVPLSSWANQRHPLEQWLTEQVALLYDLPRRLSERWVREERLLPLLDGLDEMEEEARVACIAAINAYHREHLHPLVVASRKAEYEAAAASARLVLHSAVVVQPLTREQVDAYLMQSGKAVAALRTVLQENSMLQELATTPLMLSILLLTYQGTALSELPTTASLPEPQRQLFARYVERMVERKEKLARSTPQDLVCWLRWLAQQMRRHDQPIFYLEHLQPDWLTFAQQRWYLWWAVRLPAVLIGILASLATAALFGNTDPFILMQFAALGGLLGWLFIRPFSNTEVKQQQADDHQRQGCQHHFGRGILPSIIIGLIFGLSYGWDLGGGFGSGVWSRDDSIFGVVMGISTFVLSWMLPAHSSDLATVSTRTPRPWQYLIHLIQTIHGQRAWRVIAILGVGYGLSIGLSSELNPGMNFALGTGLDYGLPFGIISVVVSLILETQDAGIALTERLHWTWHSLLRSLLTPKHVRASLLVAGGIGLSEGLSNVLPGLGIGLSFGLSNQLFFGLILGLYFGLGLGLSVGLSYWILLGLFQGVSSERIEDHTRRLPNQGVRRSLYNSMILALISSAIIGVIGVLSVGLSIGLDQGLLNVLGQGQSVVLSYWLGLGVNLAVCGGLLVCASRGGLAVLRHYVIRLLLARSHIFPWRAPRFLEEATARILLRRVGGGYSFPHRLLLDYFADLPNQMP